MGDPKQARREQDGVAQVRQGGEGLFESNAVRVGTTREVARFIQFMTFRANGIRKASMKTGGVNVRRKIQ